MHSEIMILEECAKYLKTSFSTLYRLAKKGVIPARKVCSQFRFRKEKIIQWMDEKEEMNSMS